MARYNRDLDYDPKVGDIVCCYRSGYWKIIDIITNNIHPTAGLNQCKVELVCTGAGIRPKRKAKTMTMYKSYFYPADIRLNKLRDEVHLIQMALRAAGANV